MTNGCTSRHHDHTHHAEDQCVAQTDAALYVKTAVGIIPPFGMEKFFHCKAGEVFQKAGEKQRSEEKDHQVVGERRQKFDN